MSYPALNLLIDGHWFVIATALAFGLALTNAMAYTEMALMTPKVTSLSSRGR